MESPRTVETLNAQLDDELVKPKKDTAKIAALRQEIDSAQLDQRGAQVRADREEKAKQRAAKVADRDRYNAALATASDQADVPALAAELETTITSMVAQVKALSDRNQALRQLVQDTTGTASQSADQSALLFHAVFQHLRNAGLDVRGFGEDPGARTVSDVGAMIQNHAANDLRMYGRSKGYDRANWSPDDVTSAKAQQVAAE